jgi:DNA-binding PadR family transcriptional regulator
MTPSHAPRTARAPHLGLPALVDGEAESRLTSPVNSTRLFILGALARGGPMYGHQIRRAAQTDRTELWTDIKQGSLYGALHRMTAEGAIGVVRTEQEGNMPARTVYEITQAGHDELTAIRDQALRKTGLRPDPVDLALQDAAGMTEDELRAVMEARRTAITAELASWRNLHDSAAPHLTPTEALTFRHSLMRVETELAWHTEFLEALPKLFARQARPSTETTQTAGPLRAEQGGAG